MVEPAEDIGLQPYCIVPRRIGSAHHGRRLHTDNSRGELAAYRVRGVRDERLSCASAASTAAHCAAIRCGSGNADGVSSV